jgi:serine/threonine-protein kinase HipA
MMWNELVGYAWWDKEGHSAVFQYDPEFIDKGYEIAPLMMPLSPDPYRFESLNRITFNGLPGMLSDSLPDIYGNAVIDLWLDKNNIKKTDFTPLDRLCYVGKRGMGALEYEPVLGNTYEGSIDIEGLSVLAAKVLQQRENMKLELTAEGLRELLSVGVSAGGARAKAVIGLNERTSEVRSGQVGLPDGYSHWLIKFDPEPDRVKRTGYCRIEHAYYEMARDCGIDMTECRLLEMGNKAHFMTRRFDRVKGEKVHMQTLCAMAHYDFTAPWRYSYGDMMTIVRRLRIPYPDQEQVFRRMAFNVIMMNHDDHTKNFSFLMGKDGKWILSPAYDITYVYDPNNYMNHGHQMSINGKIENITRKDLMDFAHRENIRNAGNIIDAITSIAGEWKHYARSSGVPKSTIEKIERVLLNSM